MVSVDRHDLLRLAALALLAAVGCAYVGDVEVAAPVHEPTSTGVLAEVPPAQFAIAVEIADGAPIGGRRTTVGDVDMGAVNLAFDPRETLAALFIAELQNAGHTHVPEGGALRLDVTIESFAGRTPASALAWDVIFEAAVAIEPIGTRYEASATERTFSSPMGDLFERLAAECLDQIATQSREDPAVASFLRN